MQNKLKYSRKLAEYLFKKNMKYKDFAGLMNKNPVMISNLCRGKIKKPKITTANLLVELTDGYVTLKDCGYGNT